MMSFWLLLICVTLYIVQFQITSSINLEYPTSPSRISFLKGLKSPESVLVVGKNLTVSCRAETLGSPLQITHNDVILIPSQTINNTLYVKINNITLQDGGTYYCFQNQTKLIGSKEIFVGHLPETPNDIKCVSNNYEKMTCSWSQNKSVGLISRWKLKYCAGLDTDGFCTNVSTFSDCPHPTASPPSCHWLEIDRTDYRQAFKPSFRYHVFVNVTNKLGYTISPIQIVSTHQIVKPGHVTNVSSAVVSSSVANLTWWTTIPETFPANFQYEVKTSTQHSQPILKTGLIQKSGPVLVVVDNLKPSSSYVFSIRVKPQHSGFWSDAGITRLTTLPRDKTIVLAVGITLVILLIVFLAGVALFCCWKMYLNQQFITLPEPVITHDAGGTGSTGSQVLYEEISSQTVDHAPYNAQSERDSIQGTSSQDETNGHVNSDPFNVRQINSGFLNSSGSSAPSYIAIAQERDSIEETSSQDETNRIVDSDPFDVRQINSVFLNSSGSSMPSYTSFAQMNSSSGGCGVPIRTRTNSVDGRIRNVDESLGEPQNNSDKTKNTPLVGTNGYVTSPPPVGLNNSREKVTLLTEECEEDITELKYCTDDEYSTVYKSQTKL